MLAAPSPENPMYTTRRDILQLHEAFARRRPAAFADYGGLSHEAFNWQSAPGSWSVAQCLVHLCETGMRWADALVPVLFSTMRKGVHHDSPHMPGPIGRKWIGTMENIDQRASSPRLFRPRGESDYDLRDTLRIFDALGESWEATLRRASLLDTSKLVVGSPAAAWLRFPLGTWLVALSAHEDRHLEQARRVMEAEGFPG
jgi:hypothetical protein